MQPANHDGNAVVNEGPINQPHPGAVGTWTPEGETPPRPSEDALIAACASVFDPEIPVNIYELGLIYAIDIDEAGAVKVEMTLTAPACPSAQELPEQVRDAILAVPGVTACDVDVVWDPPWDQSRMTEDARLALNMF
jgi:FeS assembly SUF system protein